MSSASNVRRWLMTGVSYMIPFVAAGGILIAIGFMLQDPVEVVKPSLTEAVDAGNIAAIREHHQHIYSYFFTNLQGMLIK